MNISDQLDWGLVTEIVTLVEENCVEGKKTRDVVSKLKEFEIIIEKSDENGIHYVSLLFQNSILNQLGNEKMSPAVIERIMCVFFLILKKGAPLFVNKLDLMNLVTSVLNKNIENQRELFEEIGIKGFEIMQLLVPNRIDVRDAAFSVSVALQYATNSTFVHGLLALQVLYNVIRAIPIELRAILPGISVAITSVVQNVNNHNRIIKQAFECLHYVWSCVEFNENDAPKIGELINRIFFADLRHWKGRAARVTIAGLVLEKHSQSLKDFLSPCIRNLFSAVADDSPQVKEAAMPYLQKIIGSITISGEFHRAIEDLTRAAKSVDEQKRFVLMQTLCGLLEIGKGKDNSLQSQISASLQALSTALVFVSEIEISDNKVCEVEGGFLLRRRPYMNSQKIHQIFVSIVKSLPSEEFIDVLIDIIRQTPNYAPEIFYLFGIVANESNTDLILSVIEEPQWWQPKEGNPRSVLALEVALEISSQLYDIEIFQVILYRIIECLASPYSTVEQTAQAALKRISPNGNVAELLMKNSDYIGDRLIARLQFIDVSPEVLTVFSALLSVDGDISDLLSHLMPRVFELLDTRDNFVLPILRMLPRVAIKLVSECESIIDRSIHFVLSPSLPSQCAAIDSLIAALPQISDEEKLLPMVHQLWAPIIMILKSSADPSTPSVRRAILAIRQTIIVARSFVTQRVREEFTMVKNILNNVLSKLADNKNHENALGVALSIFKLFDTALSGDNPYKGLELEIFLMLISCLPNNINPEIRKESIGRIRQLYNSCTPFVYALMMEASQVYPSCPFSLKITNYLPKLDKDVRKTIQLLLEGNKIM